MHPDPAETLVRCELGLCLGETRVDVAAVNGIISGWEIKSPQDSLDRLPRQVLIYSRVLDHAMVVTAGKHARKVTGLVPEWWGLFLVDRAPSGEPRLSYERPSQQNECVDAFAVAQLLWRDEAYDTLRRRGLHAGLARATRWRLWQVLAEELSLSDLKGEVRHRLKARQAW
ncbi:MAG TPA: sce7726 family protein [Micromonosporaceae bacterium]|nr:sce7726 family protein [Micromonosporaceae bacterium]